jgi:hypothetical protein
MPALPASACSGSPPEPIEIIMAAKRPDFDRQWAVQGSNLRPWD